jgi:ribosomal protein L3
VEKGKLIAHSENGGELLKLPAGLYRVESRMGEGNVVAVTDVRVRPGKMSAIEVNHQAGVARLNFVGAPDALVTWDVRPIDGVKIASLTGITQKLALKPGTYLAEAHVNGETLTAKFNIAAGEERDIMLGN